MNARTLSLTIATACALAASATAQQGYFPPPSNQGGWRSLIRPNQVANATEKNNVRQIAGMEWPLLNEAWQALEPHGGTLLVIRNGYVVGEWGPPTNYHVASVAKSLTGMAMMRLFDQSAAGQTSKVIRPQDFAAKYLPASWTIGDPDKNDIQLVHLMTMTSGLEYHDNPQPTSSYLNNVVLTNKTQHPPGTVWTYSSYTVDLLSLVVTDVTGKRLQDYFFDEIGQPIGMDPLQNWQTMGGYSMASAYMHVDAHSVARLVHLLMNDGKWGSKQILSPARAQALAGTSKLARRADFGTPNSPFVPHAQAHRGYGYLFWSDEQGKRLLGHYVPKDAFFMAGFGTNLVMGVPSENLIVVRVGQFPRPWDRELVRKLTDAIVLAIQ